MKKLVVCEKYSSANFQRFPSRPLEYANEAGKWLYELTGAVEPTRQGW